MTKESYLQMCEMLGEEVDEDLLPVEFGDLPDECQTAINMYTNLKDNYLEMNGTYLGKSLIGLQDLYDIYEVDKQNRKLILDFIELLDTFRKSGIIVKDKNASKILSKSFLKGIGCQTISK
jgi:hypothetical protein